MEQFVSPVDTLVFICRDNRRKKESIQESQLPQKPHHPQQSVYPLSWLNCGGSMGQKDPPSYSEICPQQLGRPKLTSLQGPLADSLCLGWLVRTGGPQWGEEAVPMGFKRPQPPFKSCESSRERGALHAANRSRDHQRKHPWPECLDLKDNRMA